MQYELCRCCGKPKRPKGQVQAKRWPANFALVHDSRCVQVGTRQVKDYADANGKETVSAYSCHPECPVAKMDAQAGVRTSGGNLRPYHQHNRNGYSGKMPEVRIVHFDRDHGSVSRFFHTAEWALEVQEQLAQADPVRYVAKASRRERDAGLSNDPLRRTVAYGEYKVKQCNVCKSRHMKSGAGAIEPICGHADWSWVDVTTNGSRGGAARNPHPCVKPIALTRWLATLLLPPAAYAPRRILVPFGGSGSEAIGALLAGWDDIVLVEQDADYVALAKARLAYWAAQDRR